LWILDRVTKGFAHIPREALSASPPVGELGPLSFLSGIGFAIGAVMWGNEPDTWRFGQPRFFWPLVPYAVALGIGLVLFVIGGWMMAEISGAGPFDFGPAFQATVEDLLFGALVLGAVGATVMQVAINDGNYYEMTNAGQNIVGQVRGWKRWYTCLATAALAAGVTSRFPHIEDGFFKGGRLDPDRAPLRHGGDVRRPVPAAALVRPGPQRRADPPVARRRGRQLARD